MTPPKTIAERLDAAAAADSTGEQFGQVLSGFFTALDQARQEEEGQE